MVTSLVIISLFSLVTDLGIRQVILSISPPLSSPSSLRISEKWWVSSSSISRLVPILLPSTFLSFWILELLLFWMTELWKTLCFSHPPEAILTLPFASKKFLPASPYLLVDSIGPFLWPSCPHSIHSPFPLYLSDLVHLSTSFYLQRYYQTLPYSMCEFRLLGL